MNHFRTIVKPTPSNQKIGLKNGVFTIGSCFADAIGTRLLDSKFKVAVNPFGTTYNPISIHKAIQYAIDNKIPGEDTFLKRDDIHLNYDFHSIFSSTDKNVLDDSIRTAVESSHQLLKAADRILITYGTALIYTMKNSGTVVNNCHKLPATNFTKRLLSEGEIIESFSTLYAAIKKFNPQLKFILTLSPVRHIKDTLELNSVSKAVVRSACHSISSTFLDVEYFPAYEIMMDDLRDYRFYKSDMLHPTEEAENYIWESFQNMYFDHETKKLIDDWSILRASLHHKPFHPQSESHQKFLHDLLKKMHALNSKLNLTDELAAVQSQIIQR